MHSSLKLKDPLLFASWIVVGGLTGLVIFALVMAGLAILLLLTVSRADMLAKLAAAGFDNASFAWVLVAAFLVLGLFLLALVFTLNLLKMIDSVGKGDPFVAANADRLRTMAWATLGGQACLLGIIAITAWFDRNNMREVASDMFNMLFNGLLLTLVLFILARVFRLGTRMRDDLEGTV